jgi:hypothetical protein
MGVKKQNCKLCLVVLPIGTRAVHTEEDRGLRIWVLGPKLDSASAWFYLGPL